MDNDIKTTKLVGKFDVPTLPTSNELDVGISNSVEELALEIQTELAIKASRKNSKYYFYYTNIPLDQRKRVKKIMKSWAQAQGYKYSYDCTDHAHMIVCAEYADIERKRIIFWSFAIIVLISLCSILFTLL